MTSHLVDWQQQPPDSCRGGAVAIGNFDGAHLGHAALIAELRRLARQVAGPALALTFDPHPLALLRPGQPLSLLTTPSDRDGYLHDLGANEVLTLRVTHELLDLGATAFFEQVLRDHLDARALVEGPNFGFGHNREGNVETLRDLCRQASIPLSVVAPVIVDGSEVSSSRIRAELQRGDVAAASRLLGRHYRLRGTVAAGAARGRTIGFPTANLERVPTVIPGDGVYAVHAHTEDGRRWPGAANVGANPTFAEQERKIEVHLIGFTGDLYGHPLAVDFLRRLRDTRPFASVADLVEQLRRDVEQARICAEEDV